MKYLAINHFNSYESEGVWYSIYSRSPLIWNTAAVYCECDVLVDKPAGSFPHASFLDLIPFICLSSSYSSLSLTIRIHFPKHITTCAPVHIILRSWPVCLQLCYWMFTHGWLCAICAQLVILEVVIFVCLCFLNENMVKSVQNDAVLCRV